MERKKRNIAIETLYEVEYEIGKLYESVCKERFYMEVEGDKTERYGKCKATIATLDAVLYTIGELKKREWGKAED